MNTLAHLRNQKYGPKPRIYFSLNSGAWWCVSKHDTPQHVTMTGTKVYHRIGMGVSPAEAYKSWEEWSI